MTKRFGFTLAEVLITLGIIGVVAAMTIPTLISNTNGAQFKTAYKKALSTLNQAVIMNIALEDTDFSTLEQDTATGDAPVTPGSMGALLGSRLQSATDITESYFGTAGEAGTDADDPITLPDMTYTTTHLCTAAEAQTGQAGSIAECAGKANQEVDIDIDVDAPANNTWRIYSFADGTSFGYLKASASCASINANCVGFIDVNGSTGPNTPIDCGTNAANGTCEPADITDIYPVFFHGQTVEPANDSARAVLFGK